MQPCAAPWRTTESWHHSTKGGWGESSLYRIFICSEQIRCSHCKHTTVQSQQHTRTHRDFIQSVAEQYLTHIHTHTLGPSMGHSHTVTAEQRIHQAGVCSDKHRRKIKYKNSLAFSFVKKRKWAVLYFSSQHIWPSVFFFHHLWCFNLCILTPNPPRTPKRHFRLMPTTCQMTKMRLKEEGEKAKCCCNKPKPKMLSVWL